MSRVALVVAVAAVALFAIAGAAGASSPQAHAAGKCNIKGQERKLGASYVTSLRVTKTSCRTGKSVVRAYNKCRHRSGGAKGGRRAAGIVCAFGARAGEVHLHREHLAGRRLGGPGRPPSPRQRVKSLSITGRSRSAR